MVLSTVFFATKPVRRVHRAAPVKKLDVAKLKSDDVRNELQNELAGALATEDSDDWPEFKTTVFETAAKIVISQVAP